MSFGAVKPGAVGQPISRVDGRLKTTGKATFAAEYKVDNLAHAAMVLSRISNRQRRFQRHRQAHTRSAY